MQKILTAVTLAVLALPAWAAPQDKADKADKAGKDVTVKGRIIAIDRDSQRVTLLTKNGEMKLRVSKDTQVNVEGKKTPFKELQVGDPAKVRYQKGDKENRAVSIDSDVATARELRKEMQEVLKAAGTLAYREKVEYQKKMADVVRDIDAQLDKLVKNAKNVSADLRDTYLAAIKKLQNRRQGVTKELGQAGTATAETWEDLKKGVSVIIEELGDAISKAGEEAQAKDKGKGDNRKDKKDKSDK